jgi:hypothetical protein
MKRLLLLLSFAASAAVLGVGAATADNFTDPSGDANGGPDITAVTVTNDAAGTITMDVAVPLTTRNAVLVFMDTDLNGRVSDPTGREIAVMTVAPSVVVALPFANDAEGKPVPMSAPSLKATATATNVTLAFAKADFGINTGFGFWIGTVTSTDADTMSDEAPNDGMYTYTLPTTPPAPPPPTTPPPPTPAPTPPAPVVVKPVIAGPTTAPAKPVAGKRFAVTFAVTRSDNGKPLVTGKMVCDPSVAGKVIPHVESFKAGKVRLVFTVPKAAKAKTLKVRLTIRSNGQSATRIANFRVR